MAKVSTIVLQGTSRRLYKFDVWRMGTTVPDDIRATVYAVTKRYRNSEGIWSHQVLYIGQTADISAQFGNHHKTACFSEHEANCLCTFIESDDESRSATEADLISRYHPICNR